MRTRLPLALLAATTLLSACSGGTDGAAPESTSGPLSGSITVAAAGGEGEIKALQDLADAFEKANPGTTVVLDTASDPGELISSLTTSFAAGSQPDLFVLNYRRLGSFAAKDVIEPVPAGSTDGLAPKPLAGFTFDGRLLCLPSNAASMVVYTNTALFEKAGVPLPTSDWTWDDMLTAAKALRAKGTKAIGFETGLVRLAPFVWSNGGEVVDDPETPTVIDLSSPQAREAITFLLDLQKEGLSATDRAAQDPEASFAAGKTAMYLDSRRAVPSFRKTDGLAFDVARVPTKVTSTSVLHSDGYCVTRKAKAKRVAQAFAAFAVTGDGASVLAASGRTVPVRTSVARSPAFLAPDKAPRSSQVFLDQLDTVLPLPATPTWNEAEEVTEEILTQLFAGKTDLDKAVADIARESRTALAKGSS